METGTIGEGLRQLIGNMKIPYYVCAADTAPKIDTFPTIVIQNTHPSPLVGEHWISWWALSDLRCEMFDSYGLPITEYPYVKFPCKYIVKDNTRQIQSDESNYCGIWSLRFAHDKAKGKSFDQFMNQWSVRQQYNVVNDKSVLRWIMNKTDIFAPHKVYKTSCVNQTCLTYNDFKRRRNCN
jgi:hypothetical protein